MMLLLDDVALVHLPQHQLPPHEHQLAQLEEEPLQQLVHESQKLVVLEVLDQ